MSNTTGPQRAEPSVLSVPTDTPILTGPDAPVMHVMATMRAMRRLKPDPVPRELLEELVRAATWGPSGSDGQQYAFVVVTDRAKMAELAELWAQVVDTYRTLAGRVVPDFEDERHARMAKALDHQAEHFADTPALVAACYRRAGLGSSISDVRGSLDLMRQLGGARLRKLAGGMRTASNLGEASSIYPSVQNLLLAARAHGLAANLTIWHIFQEADFRAALGVPKDFGIYALVPIGWPAGKMGPVRRRPIDDVVHWDSW